MQQQPLSYRAMEARSLMIIVAIAFLGFVTAEVAYQLELGADLSPALWPVLLPALLPPAVLALSLASLHFLLCWYHVEAEQIILPTVGLLLAIGLIMIWRIMTPSVLWQQLLRGLLPGGVLAAAFIAHPILVEQIRHHRSVFLISAIGLLLLLLTLLFGKVDQAGAQLAIQISDRLSIQTSELIKVALIIFLAWYIEQMSETIEGRAYPWFGFKIASWRYFIPSGLFVVMAMGLLQLMGDLGAVLILAFLFASMLYAGFDTRVFLPVAMLGLALFLSAGLILITIGAVPITVEQRVAAYMNPWGHDLVWFGGKEVPVYEGPGYQPQQAIYATVAGGITGTGIGFGSPENIYVPHSDFILAMVAEELGLIVIIPILALFAILVWRILRVAIMLPPNKIFERLLLVGIGTHLFTQLFVMAGGTFKMIPLTGVTVPFLSYGGMALMINLMEIGIVLAVVQNTEG